MIVARVAEGTRLGDEASSAIPSTRFTRISTTVAARNVDFSCPGTGCHPNCLGELELIR